MQLFYNPDISESSHSIDFSKEESKHIIKVLRRSEGDQLQITNGQGWLFDAQIAVADPKKCSAQIISKTKQAERNYKLHMAVAPTKLNDRFEWFLEKATEIGLTSITPMSCANSERKVIKLERYHKIIVSAMKQSMQCYLPQLNPLTPFKTIVNQNKKGKKFMAHCHDNLDRQSIKDHLSPGQDVTLLIGPEGDFDVKEITMALQEGYIPITLGNTRLRTETAAITACHSVAFINQ